MALILSFVVVSMHTQAQPMSLNVNLATSLFAKGRTTGSNMANTQSVYNLLPIISYNHYIEDNLGIGLSIGKNIQRYKITSYQENVSPPNYYRSETSQMIDEQLYYIAASIYKDYGCNAGKFYITLALSPSFTHTYRRSMANHRKEIQIPTAPLYESALVETHPDTYTFGLHFTPSFQYRLIRNLYINTYLSIGASLTRTKGVHTTTFAESLDGTVQYQETSASQHRGLGSVNMDDVLFGVGLSYRFKNTTAHKTQ